MHPSLDAAAEVAAWAASGAMALTGGPGPRRLGPPAGLVSELEAAATRLATATGAIGSSVEVDPLALLAARAAFLRLEPGGTTSCGGSTRLLAAPDGWFAVSLARDDDVDLVPAWLELESAPAEPWAAVRDAATGGSAAALVERGAWLGLPVALLPPPPVEPAGRASPGARGLPLRFESFGSVADGVREAEELVVVDLGSLWAGPLAGSLLAAAGARVVKVESATRPDGARLGPAGFFELLNGAKEHRTVDLRTEAGRRELLELLATADVVLEASRPRALEQLGIDARRLLAGGGPRVWASITGHGRDGAGRDRVAFGDDAAVAGGLVCWDGDSPVFCADAVADPTTGLVTATAVVEALAAGQRALLDVAMARVAGHLAGPTLPHDLAPGAIASPRVPR